jgi:hypothetical protein
MDVQKVALNPLKSACNLFLKDLQHLPSEAFFKDFGGKGRSVADIVQEVNLVNDHVGMVMRGEEPFVWPEGWIKAPESMKTKEDVIEAFKQSSEKILTTAAGFTTEQLEETILNEGEETTRFERCRFMTLHLWYHLGQINYVQCLGGDDAFHWMEG